MDGPHDRQSIPQDQEFFQGGRRGDQGQQHRYHTPRAGALANNSAVALHEAWHAAYAAYSGLQVLEVFCQEGAGYCEIAYPLVPTDLAAAYRDPQRAHAQLMVITGVICAQAMGEQKRFPGRAFPTSCGDAQLLARYEAAWAALPTRLVDYNRAPHVKPPWEAVLEQARAAVRRGDRRTFSADRRVPRGASSLRSA